MGPSADEDKERVKAARAACDRFLNWHGRRTPSEQLATIPDDTEADRYGDGGVVAELEQEVATLLRKPAALFLESAIRIAEDDKVWTFDRPFAVDTPHLLRVELSVGDATMMFSPAEVRDLIGRLLEPGE